LSVKELIERFGCGAFVFSYRFEMTKGSNRPKFGVHSPINWL
jgi:hypothetical protein